MEAKVEHTPKMTIVTLAGRFDAHTAPQVREVLLQLLDEGRHHILVDMAAVNFVDSTGLSTLVSGMKRSRQAGGDLALMQLQRPVRVIVELTRLDKAFNIYPDRATAEASVGG